jgi:hypothetical protein
MVKKDKGNEDKIKEEKSLFLEFIGDSPTTRLIEYLIEGRDFDYTLTDMMNAGLSWSTLNRIFPKFIENKIVVQTRAIGRIKLYKLNIQSLFVKKITELYDAIISKKLEEKMRVLKVAA